MSQASSNYSTLIQEARQLLTELDSAELQAQLKNLQAETLQPNFWDQAEAQEIMQEIGWLESQLEKLHQLQTWIKDLESFQELIEGTTEGSDEQQLTTEAKQLSHQLAALVKDLSVAKYLSGKFDRCQAILSIHPGQGGTEAMDWAQMLQRMYLKYFESQEWRFELISETPGEEAGIKEVSFEVRAPFAYGYLKGERGTHRLVRLSPFNADNLRQTSFALVEVLPVISGKSEIEIKEEDLSWKFTRAGGPGGQAVNKISSAVELTHLPTNITVKSRASRSQTQNKEAALKVLKAKLAAQAEDKLQQVISKEKGQHQQASWGTQVRNYVLHPYHLVKDTRTQVETSDTQGVLDGGLDEFIEAEIKL